MEFNYEAAKARVRGELTSLSDELWPDVEPTYQQYHWRVPKDKAEAIKSSLGRINDQNKKHMFGMLFELSMNCYWHADDHWSEIRPTLPKEDETFYATLMIEEAKRDGEERIGYSWIVEDYDNGKLKEHISEDLLREAVNRGFWGIVNFYFTGFHFTPPLERYYGLMKHKELLDLSRVEEFKGKPLTNDCEWVDADYIECFERAREKLDLESSAWLARPIIDAIISYVLSWDYQGGNQDYGLTKELDPYKEYFGTALIQDLFKDKLKSQIGSIGGDERRESLSYAKILAEYLEISKSEFVKFVSSSLPKGEYRLELDLLEVDFPQDWLDANTLAEMKSKLIDFVEDKTQKAKGIIPHLSFMQNTVKRGWMDKEYAKKKITDGIKNYLATKRAGSANPVADLANTLNQDFVGKQLYRDAMHRTITDLVKRGKIEKASDLYMKAEKEGWLDKSKIPEFKVRVPKPVETIFKREQVRSKFRKRYPIRQKQRERPKPQLGQRFLDDFK